MNAKDEKREKNPDLRGAGLPGAAVAFASHDALLEGARRMFEARAARVEAGKSGEAHREKVESARRTDDAWRRWWHGSLDRTSVALGFKRACRRGGLDSCEREALAALVLSRLALIGSDVGKVADLADFLGVAAEDRLAVMRRTLAGGRLLTGGLVRCVNPDAELPERRVVPDPALVEDVLGAEHCVRPWPVGSEAELYQQLVHVTSALRAKGEAFDDERHGWGSPEESLVCTRRVERLVAELRATLAGHPGWRLGALFGREGLGLDRGERLVLLALIGRELGHLQEGDPLFTGNGLALAASGTVSAAAASTSMLTTGARLARSGLVEEVGGRALPGADELCAVGATEYRLGERARRVLGLAGRRGARGRSGFDVRDPVVRMAALVLDEQVRLALRMAAAQARSGACVFRNWGLDEVLPYGGNVTLLFAGPPGVGKTACAEALAGELGRPILVADYSQIQNCWVGGTEKNIVEVFREARRSDAVLFWDEADAMFYDRGYAIRSWEVRAVNVLLQELERFDGVCVLATNRRASLDPALERRITLKVEFRAPDRAMRRRIWEKLLGTRMPLAGDVDLDRLSEVKLTGGQIKNVVLNAARLAVAEREHGPVTRADFEEALRMERRPEEDQRERMGF